jgi:hypothetical protein
VATSSLSRLREQLRASVATLAKLLAQKKILLEELQQDLSPEERDQIERLLEQINAALDSLEPGASD